MYTFNEFNNITLEKIIVVLDFDRTITTSSSITSWGLFDVCPFVCSEYKIHSHKLYEYYRKIEIDENISKESKQKYMCEWLQKQISLFSMYNIDENLFRKILDYSNDIKLRGGINCFFKMLYENNIPVLIVSAGISNIIRDVLIKKNCNYPNIKIISNEIIFYSNNWHFSNNIIDSINKSDIRILDHTEDRTKNEAIIIGDQINDILCTDGIEKKLAFCFLNKETENNRSFYLKYFDFLLPEFSDYYDVINIINKRRGESIGENKQYQKTKKWKI